MRNSVESTKTTKTIVSKVTLLVFAFAMAISNIDIMKH